MSIQINLDLGDGLNTTNENKLGVSYEQNGNMHVETTENPGLYVEDLNGEDGPSGGSYPDGWSMKTGKGWLVNNQSQTINDFIDMDRSVVNLIFTFGVYRPQDRMHPPTITYNSMVKDVRSICNEIVAPIYYSPQDGYTSYKPAAGELIQLVTNPTFRLVPYGSSNIVTETLNRVIASNANAQEVKAMFVITDIHYMSDIQQGGSEYWVNDMTLCCIYSELTEYVVGTTYSGTQYFDESHI